MSIFTALRDGRNQSLADVLCVRVKDGLLDRPISNGKTNQIYSVYWSFRATILVKSILVFVSCWKTLKSNNFCIFQEI